MSSLTYGAVATDKEADAGSTVAAPAENRRAGLMFAAVGAFVLSAMALTKGAVSHGKGNVVATALRGVANAAAVGTKSNVKLHDVRCGTNPLMRLSCEVHFGVFKDAVGTGEITEVTVQHVPSAGTKSMVYSSVTWGPHGRACVFMTHLCLQTSLPVRGNRSRLACEHAASSFLFSLDFSNLAWSFKGRDAKRGASGYFAKLQPGTQSQRSVILKWILH